MTKQDGGCFLDFLFRKNTPINNVNTCLTAMIIEAVYNKRVEAADFILEQRFSPDLKYVDKNGNNLMHALVLLQTNNAKKALYILIPEYKECLNKQNNEGYTPFSLCVKYKLHREATFMENNGAKRLCPRDKYVVTDYDISDVSPTYKTPSIFTKQHIDNFVFNEPRQSTVLQNSDFEDVIQTNVLRNLDFDKSKDLRQSTVLQKTDIDTLSDTLTGEIMNYLEQKNNSSTVLADSTILQTDVPSYTETDQFVNKLLEELKRTPQQQGGGSIFKGSRTLTMDDPNDRELSEGSKIVRKKVKKLKSKPKSKKSKKQKKILKELERATANQKTKFLDEALEKILALLPVKDITTAKAIRAIINNKLKETHSTHTSLDRAAEALKLITQPYINSILKDTDTINKYKKFVSDSNTSTISNTMTPKKMKN